MDAGQALLTQNNCTFVGHNAGAATTGGANVGIGYRAGLSNWTGARNVAVGTDALGTITINSTAIYDTTAIGFDALKRNANATSYNVALGSYAGTNITTGHSNTCLGTQAGEDITTGNGNIVIGDRSGALTSNPVTTLTTESNRICLLYTSPSPRD